MNSVDMVKEIQGHFIPPKPKIRLHQIVELNSEPGKAILIESMMPFFRQLYKYYKALHGQEPVLILTAVFNAAQYGFIAPESLVHTAVEKWVEDINFSDQEEREAAYETIMFNSRPLKDLI